MLSQKSFKTYVQRVLKTVHKNNNITKVAINATDGILRVLATKISSNSHLSTQSSNKKTISVEEIRSSTKIIFPKTLGEKVLSDADNAVQKFTESVIEKTENSKPQMRETRAGIKFSVSLAEKYIRGFGQIKYHVSSGSSVFLAAVLESFTAFLLKHAGDECNNSKRHNITVRNLFVAVNNNSDMKQLLRDLNIVLLGGGVMPNIHDELLVSKNKKPIRRKPTEGGEKKPRRYRPGTVALREIRKYQKLDNLLIQHAPFRRVVRNIAKTFVKQEELEESKNDLRFTEQFMITFQNLVEYNVINMLSDANSLAIHAKRETVQVKDIELAIDLVKRPNSDTNEEDENMVPFAAITKLGYRAGIKRLGDKAKTRAQAYIRSVVTYYIKSILICANHNKRRTINTKFLLEGLSNLGLSLATIPEKRRIHKKDKTNTTESKLSRENSEESVYNPEEAEAEESETESEDVQPTKKSVKKSTKRVKSKGAQVEVDESEEDGDESELSE